MDRTSERGECTGTLREGGIQCGQGKVNGKHINRAAGMKRGRLE